MKFKKGERVYLKPDSGYDYLAEKYLFNVSSDQKENIDLVFLVGEVPSTGHTIYISVLENEITRDEPAIKKIFFSGFWPARHGKEYFTFTGDDFHKSDGEQAPDESIMNQSIEL